MKRKGYLIALALVLAANAVVLAGVAYNRSGMPKARMVLTARELSLSWGYGDFDGRSENTGMSLNIDWQREPNSYQPIFTREKLEAIGFHYPTAVQPDDRAYKQLLDRKAYVVLEYNGAAWEAYLQKKRDEYAARLAKAQTDTQRENIEHTQGYFEKTASRLVLVDIGPDAAALRARYADGSKYLITKARVSAYFNAARNSGDEIHAQIAGLLPNAVNVPRQYHAMIQQTEQQRRRFNRQYESSNPEMPRSKITLAYGQRDEPWIEAVAGK
jgi:hypothetical protein